MQHYITVHYKAASNELKSIAYAYSLQIFNAVVQLKGCGIP